MLPHAQGQTQVLASSVEVGEDQANIAILADIVDFFLPNQLSKDGFLFSNVLLQGGLLCPQIVLVGLLALLKN